MLRNRSKYVKHIYWLSKPEIISLKEHAAREGKRIYFAKNRPCEVLAYSRKLSVAEPRVWNKDCWRQGSWYRDSKKSGKYLVVSSLPLFGFDKHRECVITIVRFMPPRKASRRQVYKLMNDAEFRRLVPQDWYKMSPEQRENVRSYLDSKGISDSIEEIFKFYSANRANFINPVLYVKEEGKKIPYSIHEEPFVCSACVELFGILPVHSRKAYVMKCAGLSFVDLKESEYFLLEQVKGD